MKRKEKWGILCTQGSKLAEKTSIGPSDLLDVPVFLAHRALVKNEIEGWFGDYYDQVQIAGTYN